MPNLLHYPWAYYIVIRTVRTSQIVIAVAALKEAISTQEHFSQTNVCVFTKINVLFFSSTSTNMSHYRHVQVTK